MGGKGIFGALAGSGERSLGDYLAAHLWPEQHCLLCDAPTGTDALCPACLGDLPPLPLAHCPRCALPSPAGQICGRCLADPPAFDQTLACWSYAYPLDGLIHALKYGHQLPVARLLGEALTHLPRPDAPIDLLLPMPLSDGHLRDRGFNQALEIARPVARTWDLSLALDLCQRVRETAPQAGLNRRERQRNVRHAFTCQKALQGQHVLVVDDVMTTGATLNELARTLKQAGAGSVTALVCTRALPQ